MLNLYDLPEKAYLTEKIYEKVIAHAEDIILERTINPVIETTTLKSKRSMLNAKKATKKYLKNPSGKNLLNLIILSINL